MTGKPSIERSLRRLASGGTLARTECSEGLRELLAPLLASGVVEWRKAGAGESLVAGDLGTLRDFIGQQFPSAADQLEGFASRVRAVGQYRDSKSLPSDLSEIVCVRGWNDRALACDGTPVGLTDATRRHGLFAFMLEAPGRYAASGRCALVENPAVFASVERLGVELGMALYARGRISNRILDWLAGQEALAIVHLPDYDPVGLSEHERLRRRLGDRIVLHFPERLPNLFARWGNPGLLLNPVAQGLLAGLRGRCSPDVGRVVALIDAHNAGLEQEALFLEP